MSDASETGPPTAARRGALCGLTAAALFGLSAPLAKRLLAEIAPQLLAGLLYLGAGIGLLAYRLTRPGTDEAPIRRADFWKLALIVLFGGCLGPAAMLFGLQRVSAVTGSLLLNLEAPFTILVAVLFFGEHLGRRPALAAALIVGSAGMLKLEAGGFGADAPGVLLLAAACLCWAIDNNVTQRVSLRDPFAVVRIKALGAGIANTALALALARAPLPRPGLLVATLALGCLSYGLSVVLDTYALRLVGAAREAAYFATAPFVGVLGAMLLLGERLDLYQLLAMAAMAGGVTLLVQERHSHRHQHTPMEHEHAHVHDEHHRHEHAREDPAGEPHSHSHRHEALEHEHPHTPDLHHRHRH